MVQMYKFSSGFVCINLCIMKLPFLNRFSSENPGYKIGLCRWAGERGHFVKVFSHFFSVTFQRTALKLIVG